MFQTNYNATYVFCEIYKLCRRTQNNEIAISIH